MNDLLSNQTRPLGLTEDSRTTDFLIGFFVGLLVLIRIAALDIYKHIYKQILALRDQRVNSFIKNGQVITGEMLFKMYQ